MGRQTTDGESPVYENAINEAGSRVGADTWNPLWSRGDHPPSLNTTWWPIAHSTVMESWKEPREGSEKNLKPYVYKLIEHINVRYRTFCRTVRRVYVTSEVKVLSTGAEGKPSVNSAQSLLYTTRNRVTYPCPGWSGSKIPWRAEPTAVEKVGDELWVAVKFQSNSDIAGSHRNSFRASLRIVKWR